MAFPAQIQEYILPAPTVFNRLWLPFPSKCLFCKSKWPSTTLQTFINTQQQRTQKPAEHTCACNHMCTHKHIHIGACAPHEYSGLALAEKVCLLLRRGNTWWEHTSSPWMYTKTSMSCNSVICVYVCESQLSLLNRFTTATGRCVPFNTLVSSHLCWWLLNLVMAWLNRQCLAAEAAAQSPNGQTRAVWQMQSWHRWKRPDLRLSSPIKQTRPTQLQVRSTATTRQPTPRTHSLSCTHTHTHILSPKKLSFKLPFASAYLKKWWWGNTGVDLMESLPAAISLPLSLSLVLFEWLCLSKHMTRRICL